MSQNGPVIRKSELLNSVEVAKPCPANWDAMNGDASKRFCGQCQHHVHNISEMTTEEAAALLENRTGRLCIRYVKDSDGTLLTRDRKPKRISLWPRLALAASALMALFGFQRQSGGSPPAIQGDYAAPKSKGQLQQTMGKVAVKPLQGQPIMGIMAPNPPKPAVKAVPKKTKKPIKPKARAKPTPKPKTPPKRKP